MRHDDFRRFVVQNVDVLMHGILISAIVQSLVNAIDNQVAGVVVVGQNEDVDRHARVAIVACDVRNWR
ncbi:MAG: hypothetical protein AAB263_17425, partial [Planctomycetota bacterium]